MQTHLPSALHPPERASLDRGDLAACRAALRQGSRTFLAASLLLPREVADAACALYAFCRLADDAVDGEQADADSVACLRERLALAFDTSIAPGALATPADRALAAVTTRYAIPRALPEALIEGFEWDMQGRRYETLEELLDYAARVAGAVGAMMALLMGARSRGAVARACDLGVAMQLSNIARDVGEDAAMGRLYLPVEWMREAGLDPDAWLADPVFTPALGGVVQRLLDAAAVLYRRAGAGVAALPLACRPGINAARFLYSDIGRRVGQGGFDSVSRRAVVPVSRKVWSLMRAMAALRPAGSADRWPTLPANAFLVDAVAATAPLLQAQRGVRDRVVWVIELFERLERQDQGKVLGRAASA